MFLKDEEVALNEASQKVVGSVAQPIHGLVSEPKTSQQVDRNLYKCTDQAVLCNISSRRI